MCCLQVSCLVVLCFVVVVVVVVAVSDDFVWHSAVVDCMQQFCCCCCAARLGHWSGHSQPDHQIIAIAINSGLVTYPTGFKLVWESPGVSLWRPIPPPGYVPMGCIATLNTIHSSSTASISGSSEPPPRKICVVVAQQVVVEALLAECMMLCTTGNLWCVQNSAGTFEVAPPEAHQPVVSQRNAMHHLMPSMWMGVGSQGGFVSMVVPVIPLAAMQPFKSVTAD
jgi:hypothetical protein